MREIADELPVPVLISGGLHTAEKARNAFEQTGAAGVLLARGSLGNPWLFERLLGRRSVDPDRAEIIHELDWVLACAREHLGEERATRYLRKFYPWYVERLGGAAPSDRAGPRAPGRGSCRDRADARGRRERRCSIGCSRGGRHRVSLNRRARPLRVCRVPDSASAAIGEGYVGSADVRRCVRC